MNFYDFYDDFHVISLSLANLTGIITSIYRSNPTVIRLQTGFKPVKAQRWRNSPPLASGSEFAVKPKSFHGKNDYRWEVAGEYITGNDI